MLLPLLFLLSCSSALDNSINIRNNATEKVYVNILGKLLTLNSGASVVVKDISKGTYNYVTTYALPTGITTTSVEGSVSGALILTAGTRVSMYFSSRLQQATSGSSSGGQLTYVLVGSVSSSDPVSSTTVAP